MIVLVLNSGSSSLRFQIIETDLESMAADRDRRLARGKIERIGSLALLALQAEGRRRVTDERALADHRQAVDHVLRWIVGSDSGIEGVQQLSDLHAVGHRVVHGGERFQASVRIDDAVLEGIEDHVELAPLHNPANLKGIRAVTELLGEAVPQVAVFDTAFHATLPEEAFLYGLPYHLYRRHRVRRYGFHGTSHRYLAYRYRQRMGLEKEAVNVITLHLGSGASACAIRGGRSVDTSMGFTPLEGLVMGTRSGDLDPSLIDYLIHKEGLALSAIDILLNKQSGLLGISGLTDDMRELLLEVEEHQDRRAKLAIEIFCRRVRKYVGAYFAEMNGEVDALIFAGGIGEGSPEIRERIAGGLRGLGLELDRKRNEELPPGEAGEISIEGSKLRAFVIPTDEELMIARDTVRVLEGDLRGRR
ncbi:MAG: acetate kinase [Planctomycetota bacterium]